MTGTMVVTTVTPELLGDSLKLIAHSYDTLEPAHSSIDPLQEKQKHQGPVVRSAILEASLA